jgi:hypothetical protein
MADVDGRRPLVTARTWVLAAGAATAALTFGLAVGLRDRDALVLTIALGIAVAATVRLPRLGGAALAVLLVDVLAWMWLALISHIQHDDPAAAIVVSGLLTISSVAGLAALLVQVLSRGSEPRRRRVTRPFLGAAFGLAWGVTATIVVAVAPSMVEVPQGGPGRLVVSMKNSRFTTDRMEARPGWIRVVVANPDLFWHTWTVPDLDVDVTVPVGSVREADVFLRPGRYDYVCRVPGHSRMQGVLVVT